MGSPALEVVDLTVRYGETVALNNVSVRVDRGKLCGLVGMNGSGKSTFLKALAGVVRPVAGFIQVDGLSPARASRRAVLGYVPQNEDVDWAFPLNVGDVVMMGRYGRLGFTRRPRDPDVAVVKAAVGRVGLGDLAGRQIGALSGGQRKRAFLARALAQDASILLLDEPFAGVDRESQATIARVLEHIRDTGRTVLIASHDLDALPDLCDEAILLRNRLVAHAPGSEAFRPDLLAETFGLKVPGNGWSRPSGRRS